MKTSDSSDSILLVFCQANASRDFDTLVVICTRQQNVKKIEIKDNNKTLPSIITFIPSVKGQNDGRYERVRSVSIEIHD